MGSNNKETKHNLTRSDYMKTTFRSYFLQNAFNYQTYQGVSYLNVILPSLRKIFNKKEDEDKLKAASIENLEFYNTNPQLLSFVTSMVLAMYDDDQKPEDIRNIKMALMGPLAGIGDSLSQFGAAPLFSTIFAGMALDGLTWSAMGFWLAMLAFTVVTKLLSGDLGYRLGTSVIETLSKQISKISSAASIVGVTVITGLATSFVSVNLGVEYTTTLQSGEEQVVALQEIFDQIMPSMLPMLVTIFVLYLIKRKNWNTYQILLLLFAVGIIGSVTGILV